jgi:DNA processing protein
MSSHLLNAGPVSAERRQALIALSTLAALGPTRFRRMLEHHEPHVALRALQQRRGLHRDVLVTGSELHRRLCNQAAAVRVDELLDRCAGLGVAVTTVDDPEYPAALANDQHAPPVIYTIGDLSTLMRRRVGVIGTRNATASGRATAHELGVALADAGVCVVSGLARGIDGAAHRGTRVANGPAAGVVGCGLDWPYPRQNADLWAWVSECGVLLSEWPPGTAPEAWRFPYRNRIIAALSEVLVVVESREVGGSLITARMALDRGVQVMAVPGSTRNRSAAGTNMLLLDGAAPITCVDDVLLALDLDHSRIEGGVPFDLLAGTIHADVYAVCAERACTLDMLALALDISPGELVMALAQLERLGMIVDNAGWYESTGSRFASGAGGSERWRT